MTKKLLLIATLTLTAFFAVACNGEEDVAEYELEVTSEPEMDDYDFAIDPAGPYEEGEEVEVTLTDYDADAYAFERWEEEGITVTEQETYTLTMTADTTLTAVFDELDQELDDPMDINSVWDAGLGDTVETQGVVTAITDHETFFIEDDERAVGVYDEDEAYIEDLSIGDEVQVIGERGGWDLDWWDSDYDLVQIDALESVLTVESDEVLPESVDLDEADLEDEDEMIDYQGHLVDLSDMEVTDVDEDEHGNIDVELERDDGAEISLRYDSRLADSADDADHLLELGAGDEVELEAITLGWFDGPQLLYSDADQVTVVAEGNGDDDDEENGDENGELVDIEDARALNVGEETVIEGVVTGRIHNNIYIQDETGAIAIYENDVDIDDISTGDKVHAEGERSEFSGLEQIDLASYQIQEQDVDLPEATNIDDVNIEDDGAMLDYQSMLVELTDMEIVEIDVDDYDTYEIELENEDDQRITMRSDNRTPGFDDDLEPVLEDLEVGDMLHIESMPLAWHEGPQLMFTCVDQSEVLED